jgi:hypothetical protein
MFAIVVPAVLRAQADTSRGAVEGTVYDSLVKRPIVGAVVQMVNAALPSGSVLSAATDARGQYAIRGVYPGRYLMGFVDAALDTMALDVPTVAVDVRAGQTTRVDLATPSPVSIITSACRVQAKDSTGLLIGILRDAGSSLNRTSGRVEARWADLVIDNTGINNRQRLLVGDVNGEGWFAVCLPAGEGIAIRAASERDTSGVRLVGIPANGIVRHDIALGGTARIRGRVRAENGQTLGATYVGFAGTERRVTADTAGAFVLEGPAGSQTLEVRALGYAAHRSSMSLRGGLDTTIDVTLVSLKHVLDTVQVRASRVFSRDSDGFQRRSKTGNGRFWDPDDFARGRFHDIFGALRQAPSITLEERGFERLVTMRGGLEGRCVPAIFLNGVQLQADSGATLDLMVRPDEVSGMELYTVAQAPAQYQSLNGCGSLVIWTRPGQFRPRQ